MSIQNIIRLQTTLNIKLELYKNLKNINFQTCLNTCNTILPEILGQTVFHTDDRASWLHCD